MGGASYGTREQSTSTTTTATHAVASNVGSLNGNVTIIAGGTYTQTGSNVVAPNGDVTIVAKKVIADAPTETSDTQTEQKFSQTGVSVSVSNPVVNALQTVDSLARAGDHTNDSRAQALVAATAGLTAYNTYKTFTDPANAGAASSVGISVRLWRERVHSTAVRRTELL